jgi:hypothetical protein
MLYNITILKEQDDTKASKVQKDVEDFEGKFLESICGDSYGELDREFLREALYDQRFSYLKGARQPLLKVTDL